MQCLSTTHRDRRARLLVVELWGLGDLALAMPFLREASRHVRVSLLAKPHAAPLLQRFASDVELIPLAAPWTAFRDKYNLPRWPWRTLAGTISALRAHRFDAAVSARRDPRDHALMALSGAALRAGFSWRASRLLLTDVVTSPARRHRARHWEELAEHFGWKLSAPDPAPRRGKHIVVHTGAAQPVREWPRERFDELATRLRAAGWQVTLLDDRLRDLDALLDTLASADHFIGNDSGPGHLAALFGVPTFTIFGPQLPELFAPQHPRAAWIDGAACAYKPCFDSCRFATPHCIRELSLAQVHAHVERWLSAQ